jgi:RND superfamily putative drug exporter
MTAPRRSRHDAQVLYRHRAVRCPVPLGRRRRLGGRDRPGQPASSIAGQRHQGEQHQPAAGQQPEPGRLATPFQDPNQTPVLVVIARGSGTVTAADITAIGRLTARLGKVASVQQVKDLGDSADRQAVQLEVLAGGLNLAAPGPEQHLVTGLRAAIAASALPRDLRAHLAGPVATQADASQANQKAVGLGLDLSIVFIVALLLVVFRSLLAPLLTLAPAVLVTQLAGPVIGEAGKAGLPVSSLTQILMLILTIGAGTDYGLFLVFRVREELRAGRAPHDAVTRSLAQVGESITFSAATVIAALLTMLLATFGLLSTVGAPLAIALALMLLAELTLLPALLAIAGRAAFWPSRTARGTGHTGWWGRTAGRAVAHPGATLALGLVALGALATAVLGYRPAGMSAGPAAPGGSDSAAGNALLTAHYPAATSNPTTVVLRFREPAWDDPAPVATAQRRLAALPQFNGLAGPFDAITPGELTTLYAALGSPAGIPAVPPPGNHIPPVTWAAYSAETQFISPDGRTVLLDARLANGDPGSNAALGQVPAVRAGGAARARPPRPPPHREVPAAYDVGQAYEADLLRIFPAAILVIGLLLALVMRSLIAPLYLIASVVISYLAAWGLSVLLFQDAARAGGLYYGIPLLMFVFLLALGEDYNILAMTRIREEASRVPLRQAVTRALERTGPTVSSAGLVLAGTFAVFGLAVGRQPGGGGATGILASIAIGILMDAFIVRTLLVPATVALLGRWNWWPSSHGAPSQAAPEPEPTPAHRR